MGRKRPSRAPSTSANLNDFSAELQFAGDRLALVRRIDRLRTALENVQLDDEDRRLIELGRAAKKNHAQRLSTAIAQKIADALRPRFRGILPDEAGKGHESKSKGAQGKKKLDVNYSTTASGLELAISIKTNNFKDETTSRYTKNTKRVDGELRAEAQDCHERQPFAVLVAFLFLPIESATDGAAGVSSLKHNADVLAARSGRSSTEDDHSLFELAFVGLYEDLGRVVFFEPDDTPDSGLPTSLLSFSETLAKADAVHASRNKRR